MSKISKSALATVRTVALIAAIGLMAATCSTLMEIRHRQTARAIEERVVVSYYADHECLFGVSVAGDPEDMGAAMNVAFRAAALVPPCPDEDGSGDLGDLITARELFDLHGR